MKAARDILVIDDEPVVLQGVTRICASEGISVDAVSSGQAGLERLEGSAYRLILCDIMMGDLDGFEFLAEAGRRGHRVPVVMATGNSTVQNAVRSLQSGAIDCLAKPFTADELMAVIRRGLNYQALRVGDLAPPPSRPCPAHYRCLGQVSWVATEPVGTVLIGVHDFFIRTLGGIRNLELSPAGTEFVQGAGCASIVSSDGLAHTVMCPVSGHVLEVHDEVVAQPSTIERDPYGTGWLYRMLPSDLADGFRNLTPPSPTASPQDLDRKGELP